MRLIFVLLLGLCPVICHSAGYDMFDIEGEEEAAARNAIYIELQAAGVASFGQINDADENTITGVMQGWRAGGFVHVSRWIALGGQVEELSAQDQRTNMLEPIKRHLWAGLVKWTLTPNTNPKVYAVFGAGQVQYRTKFPLQKHDLNAKSTVMLCGLGADINIWKGLHLLGEYTIQWDINQWRNFALDATRERHTFAAAMAYEF